MLADIASADDAEVFVMTLARHIETVRKADEARRQLIKARSRAQRAAQDFTREFPALPTLKVTAVPTVQPTTPVVGATLAIFSVSRLT